MFEVEEEWVSDKATDALNQELFGSHSNKSVKKSAKKRKNSTLDGATTTTKKVKKIKPGFDEDQTTPSPPALSNKVTHSPISLQTEGKKLSKNKRRKLRQLQKKWEQKKLAAQEVKNKESKNSNGKKKEKGKNDERNTQVKKNNQRNKYRHLVKSSTDDDVNARVVNENSAQEHQNEVVSVTDRKGANDKIINSSQVTDMVSNIKKGKAKGNKVDKQFKTESVKKDKRKDGKNKEKMDQSENGLTEIYESGVTKVDALQDSKVKNKKKKTNESKQPDLSKNKVLEMPGLNSTKEDSVRSYESNKAVKPKVNKKKNKFISLDNTEAKTESFLADSQMNDVDSDEFGQNEIKTKSKKMNRKNKFKQSDQCENKSLDSSNKKVVNESKGKKKKVPTATLR